MLARELGMTPGEVLSRHSSREIAEWQALYSLEAKERQRAELEARATAGVAARQGRRRR